MSDNNMERTIELIKNRAKIWTKQETKEFIKTINKTIGEKTK